MHLKDIIVEDFINYKLPSMFLISPSCDFKCCIENNLDINVCQNSNLAQMPTNEYSNEFIFEQYCHNDITKAVVIGGLEPMLQIDEVINLIRYFRYNGEECDFVIYTGYYKEEILHLVESLSQYKNIIIKFGRYVPNSDARYDNTLGVMLASSNQYAEKIS